MSYFIIEWLCSRAWSNSIIKIREMSGSVVWSSSNQIWIIYRHFKRFFVIQEIERKIVDSNHEIVEFLSHHRRITSLSSSNSLNISSIRECILRSFNDCLIECHMVIISIVYFTIAICPKYCIISSTVNILKSNTNLKQTIRIRCLYWKWF